MATKDKHKERSHRSYHQKQDNLATFDRIRYFQENPAAHGVISMFRVLINQRVKEGKPVPVWTQNHRAQARGESPTA